MKRRIQELDGLRGIAAIFVVMYHLTNRFEEKFKNDVFPSFLNFEYGHYGVQLFFIISGFVIFLSIKRGEIFQTAKDFAIKRFIRLYPTFWICCFSTFFFIGTVGPEELEVSFSDFIVNLTMFPKLFNVPFVDGVYWTLGVELVFYLLILVLLLFRLVRFNTICCIGYILLGIILYFKFSLFSYYLHGLLFLMGMNFYKIWNKEANFLNHVLLFASVGLYFLRGDLELSLVILILCCIFYLLVYNLLSFLNNRFFGFLGTISYSLYLLHQNIGHSIEMNLLQVGVKNHWIILFVPLCIVLLFSYLVTFYIEKPLARYLNNKLLR